MTTNCKAERKNDPFSNPDLKEFLTLLDTFPYLESYKQLGFTLQSLCKVTQTTLLTELSFPKQIEHNSWGIYNLLKLIHSLIPLTEWEILDRIKENKH